MPKNALKVFFDDNYQFLGRIVIIERIKWLLFIISTRSEAGFSLFAMLCLFSNTIFS